MTPAKAQPSQHTWLNITFEGLCLFEMREKSATVHFIDGKKTGIGDHVVVLETQAPHLVRTTLEAAPSHITHACAGTKAWRASPGFEITGPFNGHRESLKYTVSARNRVPSNRLAQYLAPGDAAWQSLDWVADLHLLCGATAIRPDAPFIGRMQLTHGELYGRPPTGSGGAVAWTFENRKTKQQVAHQVVTDTVLYSCPIDGDEVTIHVGEKVLVLKRVETYGQAISLLVRALPAGPHMPGMKTAVVAPLNLHHFKAYYKCVNAAFEPGVSYDLLTSNSPVVGRLGGDVEPVYCPPARVRPHHYPRLGRAHR